MDFKEATDRLFDQVDHEKLAKALGISVASIRQARLAPRTSAHRTAPKDWKKAVLQVAEDRVAHYQRLIEDLVQDAEPKQLPGPQRSLAGRPITEVGRGR
jgi:hypothetical protein